MEYIYTPSDNRSYVFAGKCAFCNKEVTWEVLYKWKSSSPQNPNTYFFVAECPICGYPSFAVTFDDGTGKYGILNIYPTVTSTKTPPELPDSLQKIYGNIARQWYKEDVAPEVMAILCRSMLDIAVGETALERGPLYDSITRMDIPDKLKDFFRTSPVANLNAKELLSAEITRAEVTAFWEALNILFEYVYILPAKIIRIKKES